jgi:hypothetical protein
MKQPRGAWCVVALFTIAACGDDDVDIREGPSSEMLADSAVLAQMRDTFTVNRIIYDSAPDLSLASARQRRPEIFRPPTPAAPAASKPPAQPTDISQRTRRP